MRAPALILLLALAGCVAPAAELDPTAAPLVVDGERATLVQWNGTGLRAGPLTLAMQANDLRCWAKLPCDADIAACGDANCERRDFEIGPGAGAVTFSVRWPSEIDAKYDAWIEDASGARVALAPREYVSYMGLVARIEDPAPGAYTAVLAARAEASDYEAALRVEPLGADREPRALLPDLVTLPPTDLLLDTPAYTGASYFAFPVPFVREATEATGARGCRLDEVAEYRATRCLRFSNAVANLGEGPLDVRLAGGSLAFTQHVAWTDGRIEEHPAGPAEWHATHAHWHNAATTVYTLRAYDAATRTVGDPLGEGKKGGICFADTGLSGVGLETMRPAGFTGWSCLQPAAEADVSWSMGITPAWFDLYPYTLPEQYVDASAMEEGGTYALCSATNLEGTLLESDVTNNEACTAFLFQDGAIELLDPEPYHTIPAEGRI